MATAVTVLCPNGRRVPIKVSPSTVLLQVLEEACQKQKLDPLQHTLKHGTKVVDLNTLFRYTNIPRNAHLVMVSANRSQASSEVLLAVQCADGSRHQHKFTDPTSTSLWDVLIQVGVVSGGGEPVVVYMNTQICGEEALRGKTLRDLGLSSGRAALRFLYRPASSDGPTTTTSMETTPTQPPVTVAIPSDSEVLSSNDEVKVQHVTTDTVPMETNPVVMDDEEPRRKPVDQSGAVPSEEYYFPAHPISYFPASVDVREEPSSREEHALPTLEPMEPPERVVLPPAPRPSLRTVVSREYAEPCDRERMVYHLDDSLPLPQTEEVSDDFFTVTQRDVHIMHQDLKKQVAMEDAPLLTTAMRQVLKEKRHEGYERTVLRVHLPDRWVLQGAFRPQESLKALVKFVRENLANPQLKFHLYTTPPKTVLKSGRPTFAEAGFVPAAIVYFGLEGDYTTPLLSRECLDSAQSALQAEMAVARKRYSVSNRAGFGAVVFTSSKPRAGTSETSGVSAASTGDKTEVSAAIGKTVPKWFKLGK